jgi:chemotaxis protein methyltransferase CheR
VAFPAGTRRLMDEIEIERIEIGLLLEGIHRRWGYDFKHYSHASLKRRLDRALVDSGRARFTELLDLLLHDQTAFDRFLGHMSITVTEMFRDPPFFSAVRETVIPVLKTYPFAKIWHPGCATGEEVYSMAILFHEEKFLDRLRIYATDFNKHSLDTAEKGVYPANRIDNYANNYRASGCNGDLNRYYSAGYNFAKMKDFLKDRITFSYHNLVTDGVFGEMNLISCRNVLIYFDKTLQNRVLSLFADSLRYGGFLCLGSKETLRFSSVDKLFEPLAGRHRIYKKCGTSNV